jgi:hypothetical protein
MSQKADSAKACRRPTASRLRHVNVAQLLGGLGREYALLRNDTYFSEALVDK